MSHSSFVRSLSEVSSSDGSNSSVTTSVLLSKMHHAGQKTPSRTPSRIPLTPGRQDGDKRPLGNRRTPISAGGQSLLEREGDRFIPNRTSTDMTRAQHAIKDENENKCTEDSEYQRAISESLFAGEPSGGRILRFKSDVRDVVRNMPLRAAASPPNKITNNRLIPQVSSPDHTLRFWNTNTGNCAKSVDVVAQVSGIIWNSEYRELVTSHGTPKNRLVLWRYPAICPVVELMEHQGRVLCIASSPNNEMVASCASDETLRIWNCFEVDKVKKQTAEKTIRASALTRTMR
ncbi:hypothetical protein PHET_05238 [Paragonimus heterotremus]|uniref:Uncharacterized protein n=1 Tax=Paragonimus heterotremus TaxID=100268 RepID=A0A8J4WHV7_9TREM|nr:hypothetical protein PHET_05238 [Paragonimus heterotremus]